MHCKKIIFKTTTKGYLNFGSLLFKLPEDGILNIIFCRVGSINSVTMTTIAIINSIIDIITSILYNNNNYRRLINYYSIVLCVCVYVFTSDIGSRLNSTTIPIWSRQNCADVAPDRVSVRTRELKDGPAE